MRKKRFCTATLPRNSVLNLSVSVLSFAISFAEKGKGALKAVLGSWMILNFKQE
jgi:hypothetical protein